MSGERIYLDNAATSWPKPPSVYEAVDRYQRENGAPAGRSNYHQADDVERSISEARQRLAKLIDAESSERIVFTFNGTDALNLALHGLLRQGDHVITSVTEHNSVLRPLQYLQQHFDVSLTHVPCSGEGVIDPDTIRRNITSATRLIVLSHASNVTGTIQPVTDVGQIARQAGIPFLVDAAQTVGHLPLSVRDIGASLLAAPGHKGLLGPLGTGFLYISPTLPRPLRPLRQGGTGTQSDADVQPESLPDKFESGNHNVPGLVGLSAALAYIQQRGLAAIRQDELQLGSMLAGGLGQIDGVCAYGPTQSERRVGVISVSLEGYDPREVASMLDSAYGIQVRSGIHCAPRMHRALRTDSAGGTVRFSLGPFNSEQQINTAISAVAEIADAAVEV